MSELIDVACDICVKQYRWPDERLGETATCRYCGTKFEVTQYAPPDDDATANDLQWFKGVGVAILVASVAVGLGSLLFIRPGQTGWDTGSRSAPSSPMRSWTSTSDPRHQPFSDAARVRMNRQAAPQPDLGAETPTIVPLPPPESDVPGVITGPPVVTDWELVTRGVIPSLRIRGQCLGGLNSLKTALGSNFVDCNYALISDSEIEANSVFIRPGTVTIFALTNPKGLAVAFSDDIATVTGRQTLGRDQQGADFYLVKNGGSFRSRRPVGVLIETGGQAEMDPWASIGIVKGGGSIKSKLSLRLLLEPGASVFPAPDKLAESSQPVITFYRLPVVAK